MNLNRWHYSTFFFLLMLFNYYLKAEALSTGIVSKLVYAKQDHPGCPENSQCNEDTGKTRIFFKEQLKLFTSKTISESKFNDALLKKEAIPFPLFTKDINHNYKGLALWESHCRQHKIGMRYYQGEIYTAKVDKKKWSELNFIFNPLIVMDRDNMVVMPGLMGEAPVKIKKNRQVLEVTYLREEDGIYYLFTINNEGVIRLHSVDEKLEAPKTVNCPDKLSAEFLRFSESPTFYASTTCKEINGVTDFTVIFGVPCL